MVLIYNMGCSIYNEIYDNYIILKLPELYIYSVKLVAFMKAFLWLPITILNAHI